MILSPGSLTGSRPAIADINRQIAENEVSLQQSDQKFRDLAKQYQGQRMSRKQAEARARKILSKSARTLRNRQHGYAKKFLPTGTQKSHAANYASLSVGKFRMIWQV